MTIEDTINKTMHDAYYVMVHVMALAILCTACNKRRWGEGGGRSERVKGEGGGGGKVVWEGEGTEGGNGGGRGGKGERRGG